MPPQTRLDYPDRSNQTRCPSCFGGVAGAGRARQVPGVGAVAAQRRAPRAATALLVAQDPVPDVLGRAAGVHGRPPVTAEEAPCPAREEPAVTVAEPAVVLGQVRSDQPRAPTERRCLDGRSVDPAAARV